MKKLTTIVFGAVLAGALTAQMPAPHQHIKLSVTQAQIQAVLNDLGQTNLVASNALTIHIVCLDGTGFVVSK